VGCRPAASCCARKCLVPCTHLQGAAAAGSHRDMFGRGYAAASLFQVIFFDSMSHRSETSAGFGGEAVRRKLLHGKAGESCSRLRRVGDEVSHDDTSGRCFGDLLRVRLLYRIREVLTQPKQEV
jgi:hypothetical protein